MKTCLAFITLFLATSLLAQDSITGVIGSGGGTSANENYSISGTIGLPVVGHSSNEQFSHGAGFWYIHNIRIISSVEDENGQTPAEFNLHQNYPNPFNPSTTISFELPQQEFVELRVFDMLGREITTLVSQDLQAGVHDVVFDAGNLPSGVYFYNLQAGSFSQQRKLMLVK